MKIFLTGTSGFVGQHIKNYLSKFYEFEYYKRTTIDLNTCNIIIHSAGKAHDLKNSSSIDEYYKINTKLTIDVFNAFVLSDAKVFITMSSVKAVADSISEELTEDYVPNPVTHYGKSKLLAEEFILSMQIPADKRVYILRPCMIHGPGNKGNLNLLYNIVKKRIPWPLASFNNKRSTCSIENLCFVIKELIENENIPSGVYNIADDEPLSTNEIINLIGESLGRRNILLKIPKFLITLVSKLGDIINLPLNSERLSKLTETYIVSNYKIKSAIGKPLPISSKNGLLKTFKSFSQNV